jgi:NADH-quinone oxidoreductase subunit G
MCLVEVKGGPPKPAASCAMAVKDLRAGPNGELPVVLTKSPMVKKAREGVMEFLLINHPLDCPICDQGGECDLQDQAMAFGVDSSRYAENKRAVEDKYIGALVKTSMNRCIHCTRCVRFTAEVAGTAEMGAIGRGEDMEITTYLETAMRSELQGNVADLCPVGALLPKPYSFKARPWELVKTESIDVMDAQGSAIRIDTRGREVMRILPRLNEAVNEEWISDKTRQIVDGLKTKRLDRPYLRRDGVLVPVSWSEAFAAIAAKVKATAPARIGAIAGDLASVEDMFALKSLIEKIGSPNLDCRQDGTKLDPKFGRASYLFNSTIAGIEEADAIMIIGANPRKEAPVLNARIRKRWLKGNLLVGVIGEHADLTYPYNYLGAGPETLASFVEHAPAKKERQMFLIGQGALVRPDGLAILAQAVKAAQSLGVIKDGWNGFSILHTAASRVGGLDLGFVPGEGGLDAQAMVQTGALDVLFNLGADEIDIGPGAFVIYQGTHGDRGARRADVILPAATYTEKSGTYVNTEGRVQVADRANFPPGDAREDWAILRALSDVLGLRLPFDSLGGLRAKLYEAFPHFARRDEIVPADAAALAALGAGTFGTPDKAPFVSTIGDFYLTNPIARASAIMAECSALAQGLTQQAAE